MCLRSHILDGPDFQTSRLQGTNRGFPTGTGTLDENIDSLHPVLLGPASGGLGGQLRGLTQAAVGPEAVEALSTLRVDVAVLGANGLSAAHGLSTPDPDEATVKRAMVRSARQVVALVDSTKIGQEHLVSFASLDDIDLLVTDVELPPALIDQLTATETEVLVA